MINRWSENKRAFALIEMLVVVLIIGILTAVALPQYKLAIAKVHISKELPILRSIAEANERFYLENGFYTASWDDLDIPKPKIHECVYAYYLHNSDIQVAWKTWEGCDLPLLGRTYRNSGHIRPGQFVCNGYDNSFQAKSCAPDMENPFTSGRLIILLGNLRVLCIQG